MSGGTVFPSEKSPGGLYSLGENVRGTIFPGEYSPVGQSGGGTIFTRTPV